MKYETRDTESSYYADGEDAFDMCVYFNKPSGQPNELKDTAEETKAIESS